MACPCGPAARPDNAVQVLPLTDAGGPDTASAQRSERGVRGTLPRLAAALAIVFVLVVWSGVVLRDSTIVAERILGQGIGSTGALFVTPLALVAAVGLWLRTAWGWWFSLIVGGYQAMSYILFLMVVIASQDRTGWLTWVTALALLAFLAVLLLPATRAACSAGAASGTPH